MTSKISTTKYNVVIGNLLRDLLEKQLPDASALNAVNVE